MILLALLCGVAAAADRPSEDALFGGGAPEQPAETAPARDRATENPLTIGGQVYWRAQYQARDRGRADRMALSLPAVVDGYLDGRPNDRVRAMIVPRMLYDPSADPLGGLPSALPYVPPPNPRVVLDQLWLNFDLGRRVFVTAGRQHVKWGTGRFWNPTDFLHQARRDPLAQFDDRVGTTLVKLHAPWERAGANAYAIAVLDGPSPASRPERVGGAGRLEAALGAAEFGMDAFARRGERTKLGADISAGLWDLDVRIEGAATQGTDTPRWRRAAAPIPGDYAGLFEAYRPHGWQPAVTAGVDWARKTGDQDLLTVSAEAFWQKAGYDGGAIYPWLLYTGNFVPFHVAERYAAVFLSYMMPGLPSAPAISLSTLGNVSDGSFVTRLDWSSTLLTHLRFEAFAAAHYGSEGGEFRLALEIPAGTLAGAPFPGLSVPAPAAEAGLALRLRI